MKLILASASPRRRELLAQIGLCFTVETPDCGENIPSDDPAERSLLLSRKKARNVASRYLGKPLPDTLGIIGADTVVSIGDRILGKPENAGHAAEMLRLLSGKTHRVYTGVTFVLLRASADPEITSFSECTEVDVTPLTEEDISGYLATGECFGKAGSYAAQGLFAKYLSGIRGDYNNVKGLPVGRLWRECLSRFRFH